MCNTDFRFCDDTKSPTTVPPFCMFKNATLYVLHIEEIEDRLKSTPVFSPPWIIQKSQLRMQSNNTLNTNVSERDDNHHEDKDQTKHCSTKHTKQLHTPTHKTLQIPSNINRNNSVWFQQNTVVHVSSV